MATHFNSLPEVERLSSLCIRVLGHNPGSFTLQGTNTYLLGSGHRRILVDTGEGRPGWISSLISTLAEEKATVGLVLLSHWHHDHTGGITDLLSIAPEAVIHKNEPEAGQQDISDGQTFTADGVTLAAFHTPGHTKDHMVFVLAEEDAMFTADNVLGHGTAVFEDLVAYLQSLDKMRRLFSGRAYPGHGPVVENGSGLIASYIAHRQSRIEQVLLLMKSSPATRPKEDAWSVMDLVQIIYHDVPAELHPAACRGILQIMDKLTRDGLAVQVDQCSWELTKGASLM
ncbi:hypothetical protein E4U19_006587 [Claviceps sp. Clav32 group G5]|nr:hypothetical protein E4U19_006587 [Claviceps sp. Clav32 group G5]KAG6020577.1 hypothetical protein E4U40_006004 [Claviceps sp. LM458 group G5]KAG6042339.1 hypothetical protein E4U39_006087 [Claviceps sp. Clav50 group G5]